MKTIECHVKGYYSSSDGTHGLFIKELNKMIYFNANACRKILGIDDYLSSYISNNIRVFTPAIIRYDKHIVQVTLTMEEVSFVAHRKHKKPEMMKEFEVLKD